MNITLKNVPQDLHARLRVAADDAGRSLNKQILHTLDQALGPKKTDRRALLRSIRRGREKMEVWLDDETLTKAKRAGRA